MYSSKKLLSALAVILTAASWGASAANAKTAPAPQPSALFQNGDRWTAIGDSITHGGTYYICTTPRASRTSKSTSPARAIPATTPGAR